MNLSTPWFFDLIELYVCLMTNSVRGRLTRSRKFFFFFLKIWSLTLTFQKGYLSCLEVSLYAPEHHVPGYPEGFHRHQHWVDQFNVIESYKIPFLVFNKIMSESSMTTENETGNSEKSVSSSKSPFQYYAKVRRYLQHYYLKRLWIFIWYFSQQKSLAFHFCIGSLEKKD